MDSNDMLRGEMQERLALDMKKKQEAKKPSGPQLDAYEQAKFNAGGEEVFALAVGIKCPARQCQATYPVGVFLSYSQGVMFHVPCKKCGEQILTIRDTFVVFQKNTFPIEKLKQKMLSSPGKYQTMIQTLKAAYERMGEAAAEVWDEMRVRESTLVGGSGSKRDIKMRMTVQTPEEAIEEMRPTVNVTGRHDKFSEMSHEQLADFFADPDLANKF